MVRSEQLGEGEVMAEREVGASSSVAVKGGEEAGNVVRQRRQKTDENKELVETTRVTNVPS